MELGQGRVRLGVRKRLLIKRVVRHLVRLSGKLARRRSPGEPVGVHEAFG